MKNNHSILLFVFSVCFGQTFILFHSNSRIKKTKKNHHDNFAQHFLFFILTTKPKQKFWHDRKMIEKYTNAGNSEKNLTKIWQEIRNESMMFYIFFVSMSVMLLCLSLSYRRQCYRVRMSNKQTNIEKTVLSYYDKQEK